jgi:hypothetical protein
MEIIKSEDYTVPKRVKYIKDKFWCGEALYGYRKRTKFICLGCWRGEIPIKVSGNWMNKTK